MLHERFGSVPAARSSSFQRSLCALVLLSCILLLGSGNGFSQSTTTPSIATSDATSVTGTGAKLNGIVNPLGGQTAVWFEWGSSTPLPTHTESHTFDGTSAVSFSQDLTGLQSHTTYYFRAAAQTAGGTIVYGDAKSFTTLSTSTSTTTTTSNPSVGTNDATAVTSSGASLHGVVNPLGKSTSVWFEWGIATPLPNHTDSHNAGSGTAAVTFDQTLSNLQPHTIYYFRAAAQSDGGSVVYGDARSFTTLASSTSTGSTTGVDPKVTTSEVSALTATSAELHGSVIPGSAATTGWFEWGTHTPLANTTAPQALSAGTAAISLSQPISGLSANTTYYYWAAAQGAAGPIHGEARSFTTAKVPSTPPEPITEVENGNIKSGYVIITPDASSAAPTPTLTFATVGGGNVLSQAGLVPTPLTTDASMYVEVIPSISRNIGVAITNPGSTTNVVTLTLRDQDGMVVGTPATVSVPARQQVARFLDELFSADAIGTGVQGSLRLQSSTPFAVLGLSFSHTVFSAVPVIGTGTVPGVPTITLTAGTTADTPTAGTVGGATAILLPQFAMSGGWSTHIAIVNGTAAAISGRVDIFDTSGNPMAVKLNGLTKSTFTYSVPAGGTFVLAARDSNGQSPD